MTLFQGVLGNPLSRDQWPADVAPDASRDELTQIGEEATAADLTLPARLMDAGTAVIIDPVDGTWSFAHGLSTFGVILPVMRGGQTVFGIHYEPLNDDGVETTLGGVAWLDRSARGGRQRLTPRQSSPRPLSELFGLIPL